MLWLTITGVKPYDGRYEFDIANSELTTREWGWVKRHSGYLPLTLEEGFRGGDPELFAVFAVVALHRAGRITNQDVGEVFDRIADAPFGSVIELEDDRPETDQEDDDAGPPVSSSNGSDSSSGEGSTTSSAASTVPRPASGTPGSASSGFGLTRSGS